MSETVFIIGAGASVPAGAPVMDNFLDVADRLRKATPDEDFDLVFRGIDALQAVHSKATMDLINMESVFAAFEMAALLGGLKPLTPQETAELSGAMARLIQRTLERTVAFPVRGGTSIMAPQPYETIIFDVAKNYGRNTSGHVSFISFNYDICLDYALHEHSLTPDYCLDPTTAVVNGTKLLKLHGSLNWTRCPGCKRIVPWDLSTFFQNRAWDLSVHQVYIEIATRLTQFRHCGSEHAREPYLAPPTWNKTRYHEQLETVWQAAARELSTAENIIVCGYSLPETDQFFRYLFALGSVGPTRVKRFWVINPDNEVEPRFRQLLGQHTESRFEFLPLRLENATGRIREIMTQK